jgi:hypothetical protein
MGFYKSKSYPKSSKPKDQGRPPLAVCATSPDPVAIADDVKQWDYRPLPQPDQYSPETQKKFSHWFNYGWNCIYWDVVKDSWVTSHKRITDQEIWEWWLDPNALIGIGFDTKTRYALIDIDYGSKYHNKEGLGLIRAALASIGFHQTILYKSSNSGGWHLLCPLPEAVNSFKLAQVISIAFSEINLEIAPGQVELFPNVKSYGKEKVTLYNRHRLPLQTGSYLLNDDLEPYSNDIDTLLVQMDQAANCVDIDLLTECLETYVLFLPQREKEPIDNLIVNFKWHNHPKNPSKWEQYGIDRIATGWTAHHQSKKLLGIIAEHGRVWKGIDNEADLKDYILKTAIACPGYYEFCRHQHEIEAWCQRWAKTAMRHRYPYKPKRVYRESKGGPNNQEKQADAMGRVREHMIDLIASGKVPKRISDLRSLLAKLAHCSERTLAKKEYLSLWHPKYLALDTDRNLDLDHTQIELNVAPSVADLFPENVRAQDCQPIETVLSNENIQEQISNHQGIEGSDRIIQDLQFSENNPQDIDQECDRTPSEMILPAKNEVFSSQTLDLQAFKSRKETEKRRLQPMLANPVFPRQKIQETEAVRSPKKEILPILKIGDRVFSVERPSYALTITQVVNDELVKAVTDGYKGAELFAISDLRLLCELEAKKA